MSCTVFFFKDTATTEIYTLSLHDALPIFGQGQVEDRDQDDPLGRAEVAAVDARPVDRGRGNDPSALAVGMAPLEDRKSTRLNSSHANISYAVFCLKKKKFNDRGQLNHTSI